MRYFGNRSTSSTAASVFAIGIMSVRYWWTPVTRSTWTVFITGALIVLAGVLLHGLPWAPLAARIAFGSLILIPFLLSLVPTRARVPLTVVWIGMAALLLFALTSWVDGKIGNWS